ncbi:DUF4301 family protein [Antarcticibacterium flavum]|uniref:DUF4301 family protein n=1 Tax=Antarcticibacterium flavum TaxID=2058175 RepID=A0A5B7X3D0_9FLAO|nr:MULTISPECIES: DUF4301 family protein [Antarcticibacterium]MCM4160497.1 DUF4301 domain-containing protein [Antarcticibacterium sp. W02-3]QCY69839.1 DUF4301 family protein [Antarcticibacterium flavum]
MKLTKEDIGSIEKNGLDPDRIKEQLKIFERGNVPVNIEAAATVGNGINQYTREQMKELVKVYNERMEDLDILKFVPASGAATRMFKALHLFLDEFEPGEDNLNNYIDEKGDNSLRSFFQGIENLPFYEEAFKKAKELTGNFQHLNGDEKKYYLVKAMMSTPGLGLSELPKGLVPFHNYGEYTATAFEEHFYEAAEYAAANKVAKLHFTVAPGDKEKFEEECDRISSRVEEKTGVRFIVSYSFQNPKTDTIAVDENNDPFRTQQGELFFRPGGHGALIENLNEQKADVVFIKNIDNVVISSRINKLAECKKMLGGKMLELQEKSFRYLNRLEEGNTTSEELVEITEFINKELFAAFAEGFETLSEEERIQKIIDRLNRPIRVCGMVKNEGEPGGGPFLVNMPNGTKSLQIIEGAQIDTNNPEQEKIARHATHFNPVDIVCGFKNYRGEIFDLEQFIDPSTSFIANKTKDGKPLKALELPGLWNGAMAKWNTVFVEVPVETFNPVKTVADLLKPSHQVR